MPKHTSVSYRRDGGKSEKRLGDQKKNMLLHLKPEGQWLENLDAGVGIEPTTSGL